MRLLSLLRSTLQLLEASRTTWRRYAHEIALLMAVIARKGRHALARVALRSFGGYDRVLLTVKQVARRVVNLMSTLAGFAVGVLVWISPLSEQLPRGGLRAVYLAIGTAIATMLVLALTLSLIPVQRSAEKLTRSVTALYTRDWRTQVVFLALLLMAIGTLLTALTALKPYRATLLLPVLAIFGGSVDLLRWHHRHVTKLLQPSTGLRRLFDVAAAHIDKQQKRIAQAAAIQWCESPRVFRRLV